MDPYGLTIIILGLKHIAWKFDSVERSPKNGMAEIHRPSQTCYLHLMLIFVGKCCGRCSSSMDPMGYITILGLTRQWHSWTHGVKSP